MAHSCSSLNELAFICVFWIQAQARAKLVIIIFFSFCIRPPPGLLPVLGLLGSGTDAYTWLSPLGRVLIWVECQIVIFNGTIACIINPRRDPAFYNLNCWMINTPYSMGFKPPGEKWQLCLNVVAALPPKPPRLDKLVICYAMKNSTDELKIKLNSSWAQYIQMQGQDSPWKVTVKD